MVALVTGAASGLGRALAFELSSRGVALELLDTDRVGLEHLAGQCQTAATVHCADVSSRDQVDAVAQTVRDRHGGLDLLINNAGISISAPFDSTGPPDFERVMEVNFFGVVNGCWSFAAPSPPAGPADPQRREFICLARLSRQVGVRRFKSRGEGVLGIAAL
jgi:NAD(P)-dependent dehydrogenase (short-subunit alcohol dehydrogenase family)